MKKDIIRDQFNKRAQNFSSFSLTKNIRIFDFIYSFCDFNSSDTLIDVACGSSATENLGYADNVIQNPSGICIYRGT